MILTDLKWLSCGMFIFPCIKFALRRLQCSVLAVERGHVGFTPLLTDNPEVTSRNAAMSGGLALRLSHPTNFGRLEVFVNLNQNSIRSFRSQRTRTPTPSVKESRKKNNAPTKSGKNATRKKMVLLNLWHGGTMRFRRSIRMMKVKRQAGG